MPESQNIDLTAEQLRIVREFLRLYIPQARVWAYGSRIKGTSTAKSNLDMVAFGDVKPLLPALREAFDESSLPFQVDLFAWDSIPEQFRDNIKQKYYIVQNGNE